MAPPLERRLGVQVVAIDPSAAFRKALRMWLPPAAVSVDAFHLVLLGNNLLTEARRRLTQETHGRRGRTADPGPTAGCRSEPARSSPIGAATGSSTSSSLMTRPANTRGHETSMSSSAR